MLAQHIFDRLPKPKVYDRKDSLARPHLCGNQQSYRNCKYFITSRNRYCQRIPKQGKDFCPVHCKSTGQRATKYNKMSFYGHRLKGNLKSFVEAQIEKAPADQVSLLEELAISRHSAAECVAMYQAAINSGKPETVALAGEVMRDVFKQIATLAQQATIIEKAKEDSISVHTLTFVLNQVVALLYEELDEATAKRIDKVIECKVIMPNVEDRGTSSTPDQIVTEMDASVPQLSVVSANGNGNS